MADTQRTRAALLALMADNVTGNISAQDFRDFMVTAMQPEFVNGGDFWNEPQADQLMTDQTVRGWVMYSQLIASQSISFGRVLFNGPSGWKPAGASATADHAGVLGVAAGNYASGESQATILRRGLVFNMSASLALSARIGGYVWLGSGVTGSISSAAGASNVVIGCVELSAIGDAGLTSYKWRFEPMWGVTSA